MEEQDEQDEQDEQEEQQWVHRAQAGDRQAFAALVEHHWVPVHRWLCGLTRRSHTAEDLTQETFLKAWTALPSLKAETCFRAWLFQIARNCFLSSKRGSGSVPLQLLPADTAAKDPEPSAAALDEEGRGLLEEACAQLPDDFRAAFLLWTQEELPYAEIAQVFGIAETTARWRVSKARRLLLMKLGPYLDRNEP